MTLFTVDGVSAFVSPPIYWSLIGQQMLLIGYYRCPLSVSPRSSRAAHLRCKFMSASNRFGAEAFVPNIVVLGITRELGP